MPATSATNRLAGILLLFLVKMVLVASSEITKHLFNDLNFRRPFLVTYVKYSMFTLFFVRYAMNSSKQTTRSMNASYAKLENTTSDEEYEVESLTAAEFESVTSDVETEEAGRQPIKEVLNSAAHNNNSHIVVKESLYRREDEPLILDLDENIFESEKDTNAGIQADDLIFACTENKDKLAQPYYDGLKTPEDAKNSRRVRFALFREVRSFPERIQRDAKLARLSYRPTIAHWTCRCKRMTESASNCANRDTFNCLFLMAPLRFLATLTFHLALVFASVSSVSLLTVSYAIFLLIFGTIFGRRAASENRCSFLKISVVLTNATGILLLSHFSTFPLAGTAVALSSAFIHAVYLRTFYSVSTKHGHVDINFMFGMIGIFTLMICTPLVVFLHAYELEIQTPAPTAYQWALLVLGGSIGGCLADYLWLRAILLVSAPVALLSSIFTIPLAIIGDAAFRQQPPDVAQMLATIPITISFVVASLLPSSFSIIIPDQKSPSLNDLGQNERQQRPSLLSSSSSLPTPSFCDQCLGVRMVDLEDVDNFSTMNMMSTVSTMTANEKTMSENAYFSENSTPRRPPGRINSLRVMMSDVSSVGDNGDFNGRGAFNGNGCDAMESVSLMNAMNDD